MSAITDKIAHEKWVNRDWVDVKRKIGNLAENARFEWDYGLIIRELQGTDEFKNWHFKRWNWL